MWHCVLIVCGQDVLLVCRMLCTDINLWNMLCTDITLWNMLCTDITLWNMLCTDIIYLFIYFIECFTTTFLRAHSWLNWVDEDDDEDEVGLKEKPEDTRYIKKSTSK